MTSVVRVTDENDNKYTIDLITSFDGRHYWGWVHELAAFRVVQIEESKHGQSSSEEQWQV